MMYAASIVCMIMGSAVTLLLTGHVFAGGVVFGVVFGSISVLYAAACFLM